MKLSKGIREVLCIKRQKVTLQIRSLRLELSVEAIPNTKFDMQGKQNRKVEKEQQELVSHGLPAKSENQ